MYNDSHISDLRILKCEFHINTSGRGDSWDCSKSWDFYELDNAAVPTINNTNSRFSTIGNFSEADLLHLITKHLGPKGDKFPLATSMTIIYFSIFLSGVFGNMCTLVVILKNFYMRTATNYYLASLALSDLLALFFGK